MTCTYFLHLALFLMGNYTYPVNRGVNLARSGPARPIENRARASPAQAHRAPAKKVGRAKPAHSKKSKPRPSPEP